MSKKIGIKQERKRGKTHGDKKSNRKRRKRQTIKSCYMLYDIYIPWISPGVVVQVKSVIQEI
jgi:hypothetical protein